MYVQFSYPLDAKHIVMPGGIAGPKLRPRSRMTPVPAGSSDGKLTRRCVAN